MRETVCRKFDDLFIAGQSRARTSQRNARNASTYIKLAVDVEKKVLAGGGVLHADCEAMLLENGSLQENVWGADWIPDTKEVTFESLINIRPRQNNFSMEVENEERRNKIEKIVRDIFEA